jgi:predicted RNase H-like HicB family nuclease
LAAVSTFTAEIHRETKYWVAHVPELDRTTQGRTMSEVEYMVRDLVRLFTDEDHTKVDIVIRMEDPRLQEELEAALAARREAAVAVARATERSQRAAAGLRAAGATVRDIGALLGVTFQRAHQLISAGRRSRPA